MSTAPKPLAWSPGELLGIVRETPDLARSDLARHTGLSPTTVASRVEPLLQQGYLVERGADHSTVGRKSRPLALNPDWGRVLAVHVGSRHTRIGILDMSARIVEVREHALSPAGELDAYLDWLSERLAELTEDPAGLAGVPLRGLGISIPAPVDVRTGELIDPGNFPAWNRARVVPRLADLLGVPVAIDNDVTLMALSEHRLHRTEAADMMYAKLGSAIGCGLVTNGTLYRGFSGGAGEISHFPIVTDYPRRCDCGRDNCLEACFSGAAIIAHLRAVGRDVESTADVAQLVEAGDPEAVALVRAAGTAFGTAFAILAEFLSPGEIVFGGRMSEIGALMSALKAGLYAQLHPITAQTLAIDASRNKEDASILGAALQIIDALLSVDTVNAATLGDSHALHGG